MGHYFEQAERIRQAYNLNNMYIGTDSDNVLDEIEANYSHAGWNLFYYRGWERQALTKLEETATPRSGLDMCHLSGACDPVRDHFSMQVDLEIFAQADAYLVSTAFSPSCAAQILILFSRIFFFLLSLQL